MQLLHSVADELMEPEALLQSSDMLAFEPNLDRLILKA